MLKHGTDKSVPLSKADLFVWPNLLVLIWAFGRLGNTKVVGVCHQGSVGVGLRWDGRRGWEARYWEGW